MTVYSGTDSPKKAAVAYGHKWADTRRRILNKRNVCLWILIALLPFLMLRLVFFYASPFPFFSPPENEAELRIELEFPSPDVSRSAHKRTALPPDSSSASSFLSPDSSPLPSRKSETPAVAKPPTKDLDVDPQVVNHVQISPEPPLVGREETSPKGKSVDGEDLGSPEDNDNKDAEKWEAPPEEKWEAPPEQKRQAPPEEKRPPPPEEKRPPPPEEKWQAPPEEKKVGDQQGIEQVTSTSINASAMAPGGSQECDLYDGDWVHDPEGPLYTNETCFYMQGHQNCMKNGRPDTGYLYWKWKPRHCDLPRFDGKAFLKKFWGKAIGFVGDSLSRNQMQSLLCMLSQVEIPEMIYQSNDDKNVRWLFKDHQVTLGTLWSPYLLKETSKELKGYEEGVSKLFTDTLDEGWTSVVNDFDVIVLSIGQWYFKPSLYIERDEVIGCHYCPGMNLTEIGFFQAYRKAVRHVLDKLTEDYKGFVVMSTFALGHFEHGDWDTGGYCIREKPLAKGEKNLTGMTNDMHTIVMEEYQRTVGRREGHNKEVQLGLLDVTLLSLLRADGHPGPYRAYHPFEGIAPGTHVQNDCLHWCLPGPTDTWNQFLVEIVSSRLK